MENLSNAFSEVLEILKFIPKDKYNKIPKKFINMLKKYCNENNDFRYNIALPYKKQQITEDTKTIMLILNLMCFK